MEGGYDVAEDLEAAGFDVDASRIESFQNKLDRAVETMNNAATAVLAPAIQSQIPNNPDANGDGIVDERDLAILNELILGAPAVEAVE